MDKQRAERVIRQRATWIGEFLGEADFEDHLADVLVDACHFAKMKGRAAVDLARVAKTAEGLYKEEADLIAEGSGVATGGRGYAVRLK